MIDASISVDTRLVEQKLGALSYRANSVMARASNRTISNVTKNMKQEVHARYIVKSGDVSKTIKVTRASAGNPFAKVSSIGEHMNLGKFKVSPNRPVKILKSGSRSPSAYMAAVKKGSGGRLGGTNKPFVAIMPNGFQGVFRRKSAETRSSSRRLAGRILGAKQQKRNAIEGVAGPSIPQIIKNEQIMQKIERDASKMMMKRVEHEIDIILK